MVAKNYEIRAMHKSELVIKVEKMEREEHEDSVFSKLKPTVCFKFVDLFSSFASPDCD